MSEVKRNSDYLLHCSDQEPKKALSDHREEKIDTSACSVVKMKEQEATTIALENSYEQKKSELNEMKARAEKYAEDHYKLFRDQRFQQLKSDFDAMKSRAEKAESENIELKEKNDLYLSMLDDERINSKKNWLNLKSDLAAKTAAVEELVSISQRAMRQWHMHMTDLQQEDLDELLKDENNHEAHDYKKLFELLTKHAKGD